MDRLTSHKKIHRNRRVFSSPPIAAYSNSSIAPPTPQKKKEKNSCLVIQSDLFGMVKWPFQGVKWPPTRGWKVVFQEFLGPFFTQPAMNVGLQRGSSAGSPPMDHHHSWGDFFFPILFVGFWLLTWNLVKRGWKMVTLNCIFFQRRWCELYRFLVEIWSWIQDHC